MSGPSYVKRRLRSEVCRFLGVIKGLLVRLALLTVFVCVVPVLVGTPGYETGLIQGLFITTILGMVMFAFMLNGDGAFLIAGALGESSTAEELDKAIKRGYVWSAVHNIEVGRDVDHLVLSPSGVLALESKWRFRGADDRWLSWAAGEAAASASKAKSVLRSKGVDHVTEVRPVLVVWGGARRELPQVQTFHGVDVVCGDALAAWLEHCSRGRLSEDNAAALHDKLTAFAAAH